jgi:sialate O-acetylesterase
MKFAALLCIWAFASYAEGTSLRSDPDFNPIFQDHAVLQRDRPIPVWGRAGANENVTVSIASVTATATADASGKWTATLPAIPAGGPYDLTARFSHGHSQVARDVLVGDVYLCSGQSNMALQVHRTLNSRVEISEANNDSIRMLTVPMMTSPTALERFSAPAKWVPTTPATVVDFSAACYYFARELQKTVHVPMGLINSSRGGASIQPWMSESALHAIGGFDSDLEEVAGVTLLRNAMIAPLGPYGLRGVVWYQGESNAEDAPHYKALLEGLITGWRHQFGSDLPFLIVQLANYGPPLSAPAPSNWANLREAQRLAVAQDGHAGLAVAIDIGERTDIHPANKQEIGRRLARVARHVVYGEPITPSGPIPVAAHKDRQNVVVSFKDIEGSLVAYGAYRPLGFELCGADQVSCRFVDAKLQADRVVLEPARDAPTPTRVRFCWADSPVCNLYDKSGLPAGPFEMPIN